MTTNSRSRIYFISDCHLGDPDPRRQPCVQEKSIVSFLRAIRSDAEVLYILGDLFDFWFEYRTVIPSHGASVLFELYSLIQSGVQVVCLPGNHDIWLGSYLSSQVGLQLPGGPLSISHQSRRLYLMHGDEHRTDFKFRFSRYILKSPICIALFRLLHPDIGTRLAHLTSRSSGRSAHERPTHQITEFHNIAQQKLAEGHDYVLCGHFHNPRIESTSDGQIVRLGDWIRNDTYAVLERGEIQLCNWAG